MNAENMKKIQEAAKALLSHKINTPEKEGEKSSLCFFINGLTEEIGKKGNKVIAPMAISKKAVTAIFDGIYTVTDNEDRLEGLREVSAIKLLKLADRKIGGLMALVCTIPEVLELNTPEEQDEAKGIIAKTIMAEMNRIISENEKAQSTADPLSDVKRRFVKSGSYKDLLESAKTPIQIVLASIDDEIARLQGLKFKAHEVLPADYVSFLEEKKASNGLDEDGFVLLRKKKEEAE